MHRLCKDIDITDYKTILPWVWDCILRHKSRHDFQHLLYANGLTRENHAKAIETGNVKYYDEAVTRIAKKAAQCIYEGCLDLTPPKITHRYDPASRKERDIGCESAMQQVYDFIAVYGSMPVFTKRMVAQQASSVEGRGQVYGMRLIRRWAMKDLAGQEYADRHGFRYSRQMKYFVKLDVHKCFPSCRVENFMRYFRKDCGNPDLIWLWERLLLSHRVDDEHKGFMIGALTSQWAAQYMISFAYHFAMYYRGRSRRGAKPPKVASHMIIFMDDMMITASSRRGLERLVRALTQYMGDEFGLTIKPNWCIQKFSGHTGIDMMGYVVYPTGKVAIRARDWIKIRRMLIRSNSQNYKISYKQAKRLTSYKGYITHSDSRKARGVYKTPLVFRSAQKIVGDKERVVRNDQNLFSAGAEANSVHASPVRAG